MKGSFMPAALPRPIAEYYTRLRTFHQHGVHTEGATRIAFQTLLSDVGKTHGFTVLGEQIMQLPTNRTIRLDGDVRDQYKIWRGVWEAKNTSDDLDTEICKKMAAGYPLKNTIFENTQRAVLYQNERCALDLDITQPGLRQTFVSPGAP